MTPGIFGCIFVHCRLLGAPNSVRHHSRGSANICKWMYGMRFSVLPTVISFVKVQVPWEKKSSLFLWLCSISKADHSSLCPLSPFLRPHNCSSPKPFTCLLMSCFLMVVDVHIVIWPLSTSSSLAPWEQLLPTSARDRAVLCYSFMDLSVPPMSRITFASRPSIMLLLLPQYSFILLCLTVSYSFFKLQMKCFFHSTVFIDSLIWVRCFFIIMFP